MKNTAFTSFHEKAGAKMVPFAGYNMPVEYFGINEEHITVREKLGVFDVSHMGEFWVTGPHSLEFLQYITSNDVSVLFDGKIQYSCFPNGRGGIVDDLLFTDIMLKNIFWLSMLQILKKTGTGVLRMPLNSVLYPGRTL